MAWIGGVANAGASTGGFLADFYTAKQDREMSSHQFGLNMAFQEAMARHGVQMRVEDAERAGINPLAALGASVYQVPPISAGYHSRPDFGRHGQNIGSAIESLFNKEDRYRQKLLNISLAKDIERKTLENDAIARKSIQEPPAPPINYGSQVDPGVEFYNSQGDVSPGSGLGRMPGNSGVEMVPGEVAFMDQTGVEAGIAESEKFHVDAVGRIRSQPSKSLQEKIESSWYSQAMHLVDKITDHFRQVVFSSPLLKNFPGAEQARRELISQMPKRPPAPGYKYQYEVLYNRWRMVPKDWKGIYYWDRSTARDWNNVANDILRRFTGPKRTGSVKVKRRGKWTSELRSYGGQIGLFGRPAVRR